MSQGIRNNQGKTQWSQIDFKALEPMVRVLEEGGKKVGRDNWRKGLQVRETIESLLRHTFALLAGEDNDQESKLPHIGHILSNAMFISHMLHNRPDMDNRQKKEEPKGVPRPVNCQAEADKFNREAQQASAPYPRGFSKISWGYYKRMLDKLNESECPSDSLKLFCEFGIDRHKPDLFGMPPLDDHVYWESMGFPRPDISTSQNANIGRSYPKEESDEWDRWADTSISARTR